VGRGKEPNEEKGGGWELSKSASNDTREEAHTGRASSGKEDMDVFAEKKWALQQEFFAGTRFFYGEKDCVMERVDRGLDFRGMAQAEGKPRRFIRTSRKGQKWSHKRLANRET